jgi:3-phenylpropionate/trans-cinnamate dioxygenase ferredoxin component
MAQWIAACATGDIDPEDVIGFDHDGLVMGSVIECPKHNGRFDYTTGEALGAPVLVDIRTYPTKVIDGTVYIEVG